MAHSAEGNSWAWLDPAVLCTSAAAKRSVMDLGIPIVRLLLPIVRTVLTEVAGRLASNVKPRSNAAFSGGPKLMLTLPVILGCLAILMGCAGGSGPQPLSGDFTISVNPASISTQVVGTTGPLAISVAPVNGFTAVVSVTVTGLPNGITSSPASPFTMSPGTAQPITFSAPAAAGTFTLQFQGASGVLSHSTSATLTVTPLSSPFLISASYYPWYNASAWQYTECHNGALREELIPAELPILGTYDSQDQQVVTQQIAWSVAGGVNVWDLEWVKPNDLLDTTIQSTILTNPHIGDIKFVIFYDYAIRFNNDFNLTSDKIATIVSDFQYIAAISSITRAT